MAAPFNGTTARRSPRALPRPWQNPTAKQQRPRAAAHFLEQPQVYRAVVGSLSEPDSGGSAVQQHSRALWAEALGGFDGIAPAMRATAETSLAEQPAFMFRGCVSVWVAGEVADRELQRKVKGGMSAVL